MLSHKAAFPANIESAATCQKDRDIFLIHDFWSMIKAHKSEGRTLTGINNSEENPYYTATDLR